MKTLFQEADISGTNKQFYHTVNFDMKLVIPSLYTCTWYHSLHISPRYVKKL